MPFYINGNTISANLHKNMQIESLKAKLKQTPGDFA